MSAIKFRAQELAQMFGSPVPVPVPLSTPISQVQSESLTSSFNSRTRVGVWECSPGRWRRQVQQAEFCHFLAGECTFFPDEGEPLEIAAGDVVYFPPKSGGTWEIRTASRKVFIVFDESSGP
jgi:uncharacterized cupin superfamily protein